MTHDDQREVSHMTQFGNPNREPHRIHNEEQFWAEAGVHLDRVLEILKAELPEIYTVAENNDDSVVFSWLRNYIVKAELEFGPIAHLTTVLMCSAAITRLARADERAKANAVLAQLEKDMETGNDDDH